MGVVMRLSEMGNTKSKTTTSNNKSIEQAYDEIKDCSADELMRKLTEEIRLQKERGVFDYDALRASIEQIKTYLPTQTYENMIRIIDGLK